MATRYIQAQEATVVTGIGTSETQIIVSGLKTISGDNITQAMIGGVSDYVPMTLSPRTEREEQVLAKVASVSGDDITLDILRAVNPVSPYNVGGGIARAHNVNDTVVISNNPALLNKLTAKDNNETVTADWTFDGDNTHNGEETFTDTVDVTGGVLKIAHAVANDEPYNKLQADTLLGAKANANATVNLSGNQTVVGVKTFSDSPIVPTAVKPTEAVNRGQMEAYIAVNSGNVKATDTIFGTTKLDVPADDVADPKALTATADRVAALAGGGPFGTPSPTNKFVTESFLDFDDFGDASNGDLNISSGTTTLDVASAPIFVRNYNNVSITGTGVLAFSNTGNNGVLVIFKIKGNLTITSSANPAVDLRNCGGKRSPTAGFNIATRSFDGLGLNCPAPTGAIVTNSNAAMTVQQAFSWHRNHGRGAMVGRPNKKNIFVFCGAGGSSSNGNTVQYGGDGGGGILFLVEGNVNITSTLNASGGNGQNGGGGSGGGSPSSGGMGGGGNLNADLPSTSNSLSGSIGASGGGGGGCIVVLAKGSITNSGTYLVAGGVAGTTGGSTPAASDGGAGYSFVGPYNL